MKFKVVVFGVKNTTKYFIEYIEKNIMKIDLIVSIDYEVTKKNHIAGYHNLKKLAESLDIKYLAVNDYSLSKENTIEFFRDNEFEIGISIGWQRLIPKQILKRFKYGVFGFHGSAGYLPFGKGRSPLNWSIIKDYTRFINHCFRYDTSPDSGSIYSTKIFQITEFDTIKTLQIKVMLVGKEQIRNLLTDYKNDSLQLKKQNNNGEMTWFKKRRPEDGKIPLYSSTKDMYNLIRAVTYPFTGAFFHLNNKKIIIWQAYPFDYFIDFYEHKVGEIIDVFNRDFIIKTIDGSLIVTKYEFDGIIKSGDILS